MNARDRIEEVAVLNWWKKTSSDVVNDWARWIRDDDFVLIWFTPTGQVSEVVGRRFDAQGHGHLTPTQRQDLVLAYLHGEDVTP